jgi:hypothetical protein
MKEKLKYLLQDFESAVLGYALAETFSRDEAKLSRKVDRIRNKILALCGEGKKEG